MGTKKQSKPGASNKFKIDGADALPPDMVAEDELRQARSTISELEKRVAILGRALRSAHAARKCDLIVSPSLRPIKSGGFNRIIIPDSHGSAIDHGAASAFLADLKIINPAEIVMLGDHVDCGGFLAQHHTLGYVAQTDYSYAEDIAMANSFLDAIQKTAPRAVIHYIEGNHERRVETWCVTQTLRHSKDSEMLRQAFAPEFLLRLKERGIHYYRQSEHYNGLRVPGAILIGKCHFWHGTSAAEHAASINLKQFGGNVVYGHTHRADHSLRRPVQTGEVGAWNPGCLCKLQPLWQHTRPTDWTTGYGMQTVAGNGEFLHINIPIVDGRSLLMPLLSR